MSKKLSALLQEGLDASVFRNIDLSLASMSISGMARWAQRRHHRDGRLPPDAIAAEIARLGLNMAGCDPNRG